MKTIKLKDKKVEFPEKFKDYKWIVVTQPYSKMMVRGGSIQQWFRDKSRGEKAYLEEGLISFKSDKFEEAK